MLSNELHLFVLEGFGAEPQFLEKLEQNFFGRKIAVKCVFDAEIYQLYRRKTQENVENVPSRLQIWGICSLLKRKLFL